MFEAPTVTCAECGEPFTLNSAMLRALAVLKRDLPDVVPVGYMCEPCSDAADESQDYATLWSPPPGTGFDA